MAVGFIPHGTTQPKQSKRSVSSLGQSAELVGIDGVLDHKRLQDVLSRLTGRIAQLEAKTSPDAIEFERLGLTNPTTVSFEHSFGTPVRWYVTSFRATGSDGVIVREEPTSSLDTLVLRFACTGDVIVRVEKSDHPQSKT